MLFDEINLSYITFSIAEYKRKLQRDQSWLDKIFGRPIVIPPGIKAFIDCADDICANPERLKTARAQIHLYKHIGAWEQSGPISSTSPEWDLFQINWQFLRAMGDHASKLLKYLSKESLLNEETYSQITLLNSVPLQKMISEFTKNGRMNAEIFDLFVCIAPEYMGYTSMNESIILLSKVPTLSNQWLSLIRESATPFLRIYSNVKLMAQISELRADYLTDVKNNSHPESILHGIETLMNSNLITAEIAEHLLKSKDPADVARAIVVAHVYSLSVDIDLLKKLKDPCTYMRRLLVLNCMDRLNSMTIDFLNYFENSDAAFNVLQKLDDKLLTRTNLDRLKTKDECWLSSFSTAITTFTSKKQDFADQFELLFASKTPAITANCTTDLLKYGLWNAHTKKIMECANNDEQSKITTALSFLSNSAVLSDKIYEVIEENLANNHSSSARPTI